MKTGAAKDRFLHRRVDRFSRVGDAAGNLVHSASELPRRREHSDTPSAVPGRRAMSEPSRLASELMEEFAARTGLEPEVRRAATCGPTPSPSQLPRPAPRRRRAPPPAISRCALVDQVHHTLGRHRPDDPRQRLDQRSRRSRRASAIPPRGGLRIGKEHARAGAARAAATAPGVGPRRPVLPLPHPLDARAPPRAARRRATPPTTAGRASWRRPRTPASPIAGAAGPARMVWKMSVDLCRPLVPTMGHHDPLDALVTYLELQTAPLPGDGDAGPDLGARSPAPPRCAPARAGRPTTRSGSAACADAAWLAEIVLRRGADHRPLLRGLLVNAVASLRSEVRAQRQG